MVSNHLGEQRCETNQFADRLLLIILIEAWPVIGADLFGSFFYEPGDLIAGEAIPVVD